MTEQLTLTERMIALEGKVEIQLLEIKTLLKSTKTGVNIILKIKQWVVRHKVKLEVINIVLSVAYWAINLLLKF